MDKKIGLLGLQTISSGNKTNDIKRVLKLIDEAFQNYSQIDLICLPEMFLGIPEERTAAEVQSEFYDEFSDVFSGCAKKYKVNIVSGTFPMKNGDKLLNTALVFNRNGELKGHYSKAHLFDALGKKESDIVDPGDSLGIFDLDIGRLGAAVCYELRFPEYIRTICLKDIDILAVPAAFYSPRHDTWNTLVKAAALQNLKYVFAVNQFGNGFFGRSCIADPLGNIISQASDREGYFYGIADLGYEAEAMLSVNTYNNRRPELYHVT